MPLIKSGSREAISTNISEMVHAGHPRDQAIAAALSTARRYGAHRASGGFAPPIGERYAQRQLMHEGFLHSTVPGRTDKLPISVKGGAYVLPADHVAALGQSNSLAGAAKVGQMFKSGPYGTAASPLKAAPAHVPHLNLNVKAPAPPPVKPPKFAHGGHSEAVPIIAAGGEVVIPPEKIVRKYGNLKRGHREIDKWVLRVRKKHIKTLRKLKPPKSN